jgi:hypothetical protein
MIKNKITLLSALICVFALLFVSCTDNDTAGSPSPQSDKGGDNFQTAEVQDFFNDLLNGSITRIEYICHGDDGKMVYTLNEKLTNANELWFDEETYSCNYYYPSTWALSWVKRLKLEKDPTEGVIVRQYQTLFNPFDYDPQFPDGEDVEWWHHRNSRIFEKDGIVLRHELYDDPGSEHIQNSFAKVGDEVRVIDVPVNSYDDFKAAWFDLYPNMFRLFDIKITRK